jgi:hypothetical protein
MTGESRVPRRRPPPRKTGKGSILARGVWDAEVEEAVLAVGKFQQEKKRSFLPTSEILGILRGLGWRKAAKDVAPVATGIDPKDIDDLRDELRARIEKLTKLETARNAARCDANAYRRDLLASEAKNRLLERVLSATMATISKLVIAISGWQDTMQHAHSSLAEVHAQLNQADDGQETNREREASTSLALHPNTGDTGAGCTELCFKLTDPSNIS